MGSSTTLRSALSEFQFGVCFAQKTNNFNPTQMRPLTLLRHRQPPITPTISTGARGFSNVIFRIGALLWYWSLYRRAFSHCPLNPAGILKQFASRARPGNVYNPLPHSSGQVGREYSLIRVLGFRTFSLSTRTQQYYWRT